MHFLATRASTGLLRYEAGSTDGMKKVGDVGQNRGSSLLASPHLSVLTAHLFIISPAKFITHLPGKSCDTKDSQESFALHEKMKALTWENRFPWNDMDDPYLYAFHHCRLKENEFWIVESGINDFLIHYGLFKFLYLPSLFSLHQCWKIDFFRYLFVVVALCLAQCTSGRRYYPMTGKRKMKNTIQSPKRILRIKCSQSFLINFFESCLLLLFMSKYLMNRWFLWKNGSIWKSFNLSEEK